MKKVSVIVPVYNASDYVSRCIESILKQTYQNFELILIDDGSTDNSLEILRSYLEVDKRVRVITQKNMGVAKTRNKGIQLARGEYIAFIDNDDYIDEDYLFSFINGSDGIDIIIGGYRRVNSNGKVLLEKVLVDKDWAKYTFITPWARIYRREFLLKNHIKFFSYLIGEDVYFNLMAYSFTKNIKIISYVGYNWYYNELSVSNTIHKNFNKNIDITKFLDKIYDLRKLRCREYIDYYCYRFGIWYLFYSGSGSSRDRFMEEYQRIKKWNYRNNITMNIFPFSIKLLGESFFDRSVVLLFFILDKLKLISLLARIYCKG